MNTFLTEWTNDLKTLPVGPLGIIAMAGCEEMGEKVNSWLLKWHDLQETQDKDFYTKTFKISCQIMMTKSAVINNYRFFHHAIFYCIYFKILIFKLRRRLFCAFFE